mgnify:FL=1
MIVYKNNSPYAKLVRMQGSVTFNNNDDVYDDDRRVVETISRDGSVGFEACYESASGGDDHHSVAPYRVRTYRPEKRPLSKVFHPRSRPRYSR